MYCVYFSFGFVVLQVIILGVSIWGRIRICQPPLLYYKHQIRFERTNYAKSTVDYLVC